MLVNTGDAMPELKLSLWISIVTPTRARDTMLVQTLYWEQALICPLHTELHVKFLEKWLHLQCSMT